MQYARTAVDNRATLLAVEADWLKSIRVDLVVSIHLCACPLGILFSDYSLHREHMYEKFVMRF